MAYALEIVNITKLLMQVDYPTILDLGAFGGEDSLWMRDACNGLCRNILVEPDPRNAEECRKNVPSAIVVEAAIAAHTGVTRFYAATGRNQDTGSIRAPKLVSKFWPEITFAETTVKCWTLDDLMDDLNLYVWPSISDITLIWSDLQGAAREMIQCGRRTLARTRYLLIETDTQEYYEGQAMRDEMLALLPGWRVLLDVKENVLLERIC